MDGPHTTIIFERRLYCEKYVALGKWANVPRKIRDVCPDWSGRTVHTLL